MQKRIFLHVTEKPKTAKTIANILCSKSSPSKETLYSKQNPIFRFEYKQKKEKIKTIVTSTNGHIKELVFKSGYRRWNLETNFDLIEKAEIEKEQKEDQIKIIKNLEQLAFEITDVVFWQDCNQEGEEICFEIFDIIQQKNSDIKAKRALFSAFTKRDIEIAMNCLRNLDPIKKNVKIF